MASIQDTFRVFIDVDGVIANFDQSYLKWCGCEDLSLPTHWEEILERTNTTYEDIGEFFSNDDNISSMEKLPYADYVADLGRRLTDDYELIFVTAACGYARYRWLKDRYPACTVIQTKAKHHLAGPETVLIDDYEKNVDAFEEAGGNVILFPQPWNRNRDYVDARLEYVWDQLKELYIVS